MIPEEALANLTDDPQLAFVQLEKKLRDELNEISKVPKTTAVRLKLPIDNI